MSDQDDDADEKPSKLSSGQLSVDHHLKVLQRINKEKQIRKRHE